jgi:hypothetical protein
MKLKPYSATEEELVALADHWSSEFCSAYDAFLAGHPDDLVKVPEVLAKCKERLVAIADCLGKERVNKSFKQMADNYIHQWINSDDSIDLSGFPVEVA